MRARQAWQDAFDTQMGIWHWLRSNSGMAWIAEKYQVEVLEPYGSDTRMTGLLEKLYMAEAVRMVGASPYFVSREMCQLVQAAAETFEPEKFFPSDLMSPTGFLHYEQTLPLSDRNNLEIQLGGFSWTPILSRPKDGDERRYVRDDKGRTVWAEYEQREDNELLQNMIARQAEGGHIDGVGLTLYATVQDETWPPFLAKPPLVPMHLTPWWFDMEPKGYEIDENEEMTAAARWWKVIQTTLRLMQQHVSVRHRQQATRPQRREARRRGFDAGDEVTVVRLRRESVPAYEAHESEPANYSHRFIVSGHWRNQWYPASNLHRQIWIAPYVKGPENKPLVVKPSRAFVWSR